MSSRIEQLIDEIEEYIDSCKYQPLSNSKIIVNKEELEELLRELRMKTPDEIKRYQKIINNKEAILNDAREKAEALINEATVHTSELINEQESIIGHGIDIATDHYGQLINDLNSCLNIVQSNRMELRPDEEDDTSSLPNLSAAEDGGDNSNLNLDIL